MVRHSKIIIVFIKKVAKRIGLISRAEIFVYLICSIEYTSLKAISSAPFLSKKYFWDGYWYGDDYRQLDEKESIPLA